VKLWVVRKHVNFNDPAKLLYEIPEEFQPVLDTEQGSEEAGQQARYDVSIADLLTQGLLKQGQALTMTWKPRSGDKQVFQADVNSNGELTVLGKSFASPSYAAVYAFQSAGSKRTTENGWTKWKTLDGTLLSSLREQYLAASRMT
jgi:hypothetical protein